MKKLLLFVAILCFIPFLSSANAGVTTRAQAIKIKKLIKQCPIAIPDIAKTISYMTGDDNAGAKYKSGADMAGLIQESLYKMKDNEKCNYSRDILNRNIGIYSSTLKSKITTYRLLYIQELTKELIVMSEQLTKINNSLSKDRFEYDTCVYNNGKTNCGDTPEKKIENHKMKMEDKKFWINTLKLMKE